MKPQSGGDSGAFDVAVIGMSGRFPGAPEIETFWKNLCNGVETISVFEEPKCAIDDPSGTRHVRARGVLENIETFDCEFFEMSPRQAELLDPQQRLFLECAWEALEVAGHSATEHSHQIGVFASTSISTYLFELLASRPELAADRLALLLGNDKDFLATRVSYKLDLKGPSVTVQTACSSSLVAVCLAWQNLITFQCDIALAGGVSICIPQIAGYDIEPGMHSLDGHCRAFDVNASGMVPGNGVGVVVLRRLQDAISDNDSILAIIKGTALNNDGGGKAGFTAPSVQQQADVISIAHATAGISAESVDYIEAHGTGTRIGDVVEVKALVQAFRRTTDALGFCGLGSVKTNIGHLDAAAGVAGLIKTILALQHKAIPPSLHCSVPNPELDLATSPFYVVTSKRDWPARDWPRRAGISSFGIGGTNAHVVLEEAPSPVCMSKSRETEQLVVLSAKSQAALEDTCLRLAYHLGQKPESNMLDVAYTLGVGRKEFRYRVAVACRNKSETITTLKSRKTKEAIQNSVATSRKGIIFALGNGAGSCPGEIRSDCLSDLSRVEYEFSATIREFEELCGCSIYSVINSNGSHAMHTEALFAYRYLYVRSLMTLGLAVNVFVAHGIGELLAACLLGVIDLRESLSVLLSRRSVCERASNSPRGEVRSDGRHQVDHGTSQAQEERLDTAEHHTVLSTSEKKSKGLKAELPEVKIYCAVTGEQVDKESLMDRSYWSDHELSNSESVYDLPSSTDAAESIVLSFEQGVECPRFVQNEATPSPSVARRALMMDPPIHLIGKLWTLGAHVDWVMFYSNQGGRRIALPTYPFQRDTFWALRTTNVQAAKRLDEQSNDVRLYGRPRLPNPYVAPRTKTQSKLAGIWGDCLGIDKVGVEDDFFLLGGDSLTTTEIASRIQRELNVVVSPALCFRFVTIRSFADYLEAQSLLQR
ncbi:MAG: beta-ketoacyl synthase N-terminal-like domain-containing protein [Candidatus Binataceae bacterium]